MTLLENGVTSPKSLPTVSLQGTACFVFIFHWGGCLCLFLLLLLFGFYFVLFLPCHDFVCLPYFKKSSSFSFLFHFVISESGKLVEKTPSVNDTFFIYSRPPRHLQSCVKKHSRSSWDILDLCQAFEATVIFPPTLIFLWAGWLLLLSTSMASMAAVFRYELGHKCVDSVLLIHPYVSCINNSRLFLYSSSLLIS